MKVLLSTMFVLTTLIAAGSALLCYNCGGDPDCATVKDCPQPTLDYLENTRARYFPDSKVDYSKSQNLPKPACYTSITTEGGQKVARRACSALGSELTCDVLRANAKSRNEQVESCITCTGDFCNSMHPNVPVQTGGTVATPQPPSRRVTDIIMQTQPSIEFKEEIFTTTEALPIGHSQVDKSAATSCSYVKLTLMISVLLTVIVSVIIS